MGRALLVGIDEYDSFPALAGCVNDAKAMHDLLETHADGSPNFSCRLVTSEDDYVTRRSLRSKWLELFSNYDGDILFYFAGHGVPTQAGAVLATQDGVQQDPGLPMDELLTLANHAYGARSVTLILDCCHSGSLGTPALFAPSPSGNEVSILAGGVTVMAATRPEQLAQESGDRGVFTELLETALTGGAADTLGNVTAASMYAFVEQALGPWDQRPLYRTNAQRLRPVRRCKPKISKEDLRKIVSEDLFPTPEYKHNLDPSYEHTREEQKEENVAKLDYFKLLRDSGLLSTGGEDLYWLAVGPRPPGFEGDWSGVALNEVSDPPGYVELNTLGRSFWHLVRQGRI